MWVMREEKKEDGRNWKLEVRRSDDYDITYYILTSFM